jgi:hypothetical protein
MAEKSLFMLPSEPSNFCRYHFHMEIPMEGHRWQWNTAHSLCMLVDSGYRYTRAECVILIAFPRQKRLRERTAVLRLYVNCLPFCTYETLANLGMGNVTESAVVCNYIWCWKFIPHPLPNSVQGTMVSQFVFETPRTKHLIFGHCRGFACIARGFSALHILLFWINLSSQIEAYFVRKTKIVEQISPFLWKKMYFWLQIYRSTCNQLNWSKSVHLCWKTRQILQVSIAAGGQILMYTFEYLSVSGLWVASYTVHAL